MGEKEEENKKKEKMSSAAERMRERQIAARKALKGDGAPAPPSTVVGAATVNTIVKDANGNIDPSTLPPSEDDALIDDFIRRTRNQGPMPYSPFTRIDLVVVLMILVAFYYYLLVQHKIDVWPHVWHYIGPHYDHHDEPGHKPPEIDPKFWDL